MRKVSVRRLTPAGLTRTALLRGNNTLTFIYQGGVFIYEDVCPLKNKFKLKEDGK